MKRAESRASAPLTRGRLLDQVDARRFQRFDAERRIGFVPGLVHIDGDLGAVAERRLDLRHVRDIVANAAPADLQLERVVTALGQQHFGFFDIALGIAARERPEHGQRLADRAAEQFRHRHAQALALRVEQRRFDRGLGEAVAARDLVQPEHRAVDIGRILSDERGREISIDGQLDPLGTFIAVRQAADRRGFAKALDAVARAQTDDDEGLLLHRRHGELMRANGREVNQNRFDGCDLGVHTWNVGMEGLLKYCAPICRLSNTVDV